MGKKSGFHLYGSGYAPRNQQVCTGPFIEGQIRGNNEGGLFI